jgi:hypothetical protein
MVVVEMPLIVIIANSKALAFKQHGTAFGFSRVESWRGWW